MAAARNLVIVFGLAALVWLLPAGGQGANTAGAALAALFSLGLLLFVGRMYLERRTTLFGLDDRYRALLYGAAAVGFLTLTATPRLLASSAGTAAWIALLAGVVMALLAVVRYARSY
ncbi:MAG: hypothetical protein E6G56_03945 [Actinobacteria bacterium]|nr:MAG: hypothetical protein E6G56_03945 [Actinomycetota bacterium]